MKKIFFIPCMIFGLLLAGTVPSYAALPNTESFDYPIHFEQGNGSFEIEKEAVREVTPAKPYLDEEADVSALRTYTLQKAGLPDMHSAKQWKPVQTIEDRYKQWSITFNAPVNVTEENTYKVKILDESGEEIDPIVSINKEIMKIKPADPYKEGMLYTLLISKDLDSHKGVRLDQDVYLQFVYKAPVSEDDSSATEKSALYSVIYTGLLNMEDEIFVGDYTKDSKVFFDELEKVLKDHPDIFYFQYKGSSFWTTGRFEAKYAYPKESIVNMLHEMDHRVDTLYAEALRPGMTDYEKVKAIHDYVVLNTAYDYDNFLHDTVPKESYTMYGLLVKNTAVCDGYAKTMVYLLNQIGIETMYVPSSPAMNHAWNKVKIDGEWYNLDVTWDDPVPDRQGQIAYGYFLVPDSQLAKTHSWNNAGLPKASSKKYEFVSTIWASDSENGWIYYANKNDDIKLYKMRTDGSENQKISDTRANEIVVFNSWIYFSNYSNGGFLYKMRTDGSSLTQLTDFLTTNISRDGTNLYFTDDSKSKNYYMDMDE